MKIVKLITITAFTFAVSTAALADCNMSNDANQGGNMPNMDNNMPMNNMQMGRDKMPMMGDNHRGKGCMMGCKRPMMMQMMKNKHAHMHKMEQRLANIEALLEKIVAAQVR